MHCDKDETCYGHPEWRVIVTFDYLGKPEKQKLNYCDKCYNDVNPEHKKFLIKRVSELDTVSVLETIKQLTHNPDIQRPEGYEEQDEKYMMIFRFRRLVH